MLEKVRLIWIKGILEPSLYHLARIELGIETQPDAVERPFDLFVQQPEQAPQPLPTGTPISRIFDEAGKALLILGQPGAGKTTLLLELTRDLLDRAEQDERHLIPVVFHLSSWAAQRFALADWLMDELNKRYDVPRIMAKSWVDAGLILPLLDGLDEVAADHREACVEAINVFLREHGLLPLVVCSRAADYTALTRRLRLPSAVMIQALSRQQVQHYVDQVGASLAGLRTVLQADTTWLPVKRQERQVTFVASVMSGVVFGPAGLVAWPDIVLETGLGGGLMMGLCWGLIGGLSVGLRKPKIGGLGGGLVWGLISGLVAALDVGLGWGLGGGLFIGVCVWGLWALVDELPDWFTVGEIGTQLFPNEGIRRSARNASISGLAWGLGTGLLIGLGSSLQTGWVMGLGFGLISGMRFGGSACLHHFALRLVLWYNNFAPLNYIRFLDHCTARIFLRKTGGGYVFVHRLLLEYFAGMLQTSAES
jgi:GTPase SAR1 family protein